MSLQPVKNSFHIFAWARPEYVKGSASVGIVYKPTRIGSIIEVKRIEGRSFESKERRGRAARAGAMHGMG
jgi:hypothetical protein